MSTTTVPAGGALHQVVSEGVSIWLDDLSRDLIGSGELARLITERSVVGVTTNPTIFAGALRSGGSYDAQLQTLAADHVGVEDAVFRITTDDVRDACDVLEPIHREVGHGDGRVSIEVDPRLARDAAGTLKSARELWWAVNRPNLYIKIPATVEGLAAITQALSEGISVNVTLIFSVERYAAVLDAFMRGLEGAREAGRDLSTIASVASFFVSRVDTEIDGRLDAQGGTARELKGTAAIANARLAFALYLETVASTRWQVLADAGAQPQRPLWASTGVKDPNYPDTLYVDELVARGVVNTMPRATLEALADHGRPHGDTLTGTAAQSKAQLADLQAAGIDMVEVTDLLEQEGLVKFERSWQELLDTVDSGLRSAQ